MTTYLPRIALTDEMDSQLQAYRRSHDIPPTESSVVRLALAEFLKQRGFLVEDVHPQRGGDRRTE